MLTERVQFRYIAMECCNHQLCWVNPRLPSYCPACGARCFPQVRSWVLINDEKAQLKYRNGTNG